MMSQGKERGGAVPPKLQGMDRAGQGRVMSSNGFNFGFDGWKNKCVG